MSSLTTVAQVRALVPTALEDPQLQAVIDRVEADLTEALGAPFADASTTISETVRGGQAEIFLRRPVLSVSSVTEYALLSDATGQVLVEGTDFYVWPSQGRLTRLAAGIRWGQRVDVVYVPQDQRSKRKQAVIDLVRLVLARTPLQSESVGGEFRYDAPEWEAERRKVLRRLSFVEI